MADIELTTGLDVNLELENLITTSVETSLRARIKALKLPASVVKQDLGIEFKATDNSKQVIQLMEKQRAALTTALEEIGRAGSKRGTVALPTGAGSKTVALKAGVDQIVSLRDTLDAQLSYMSQTMKDFRSSGMGKLIKDVRSGKRTPNDLTAAEMAEFQKIPAFINETVSQMRTLTARARGVAKTISYESTSDEAQQGTGTAKRIPLVMDSMAASIEKFALLGKAISRDLQTAAAAEQAFEESLKRSVELRRAASMYAGSEAAQKKLVTGQKDSELAVGKEAIQARLKNLAEARKATGSLPKEDDREFERLRTAAQFIKLEQNSRNDYDKSVFDAERTAAATARQQAEQEQKQRDATARRRQEDFDKALRRRDELLRVSETSARRADSYGELRQMPAADRDNIMADLRRQAGGLRDLKSGFADPNSDKAVNAGLARLDSIISELTVIKNEEIAVEKAALAAQKAINDEKRAEGRRASQAQDSFTTAANKRAEALRLSDNAMDRLARAGTGRPALVPAEDRKEVRGIAGRELGNLKTLQRGLGDGQSDQAIQLRINSWKEYLKILSQVEKAEKDKAAADKVIATKKARDAEKSKDKFFNNLDKARAIRGTQGELAAVTDFGQVDKPLRNELQKNAKEAINNLQALRKELVKGTASYIESTKQLKALEKYSEDIRKANKAEAAAASAAAAETKRAMRPPSATELRAQALTDETANAGSGGVAPEFKAQLPSFYRNKAKELTAELGAANVMGPPAPGAVPPRAPSDIRRDLAANQAALDELGEAAKRNGGLLQSFFRYALGYGALYQVLNVIKMLTMGVIDLSSKLVEIRAVAGLTNSEMRAVGSVIEDTAGKFAFSVTQVSEAALTLAQAGVDMKDMNSTLNAVASFATATGSNLQQAADLITSLRDVYSSLDPNTISNALTQSVNISKLTGSDLQTIIGLSAGVAKSFNLTIEQYLAAAATLRNAGLKASTVATGLRQTMLEVFNPDEKLLKVLQARYKKLGEDKAQAEIKAQFFGYSQGKDGLGTALSELERLGMTGSAKSEFEGAFDIRTRNAIEAMARNRTSLAAFEAELGAGSSASISAAENLKTVQGALHQLRNESVLLATQLVRDTLPAIRDIIKGFADGMGSLRGLDKDLKSGGGNGIATGIIGSSLTSGLLAAAATPGGLAAKAGAFAGWGLAGGIGAFGATSAANKMGATPGTAEAVGTAAGVIVPLLTKSIVTRMAPSLASFGASVMANLPVFGRLGAAMAAGGPVSLFIGALGVIVGLMTLYANNKKPSASEQLVAVTDDLAQDAGTYRDAKNQAQSFGGKREGVATELAGIADDSKRLTDQVSQLVGGNAADIKRTTELLKKIYTVGLDATGATRKELVAEFNEITNSKQSDQLINSLAKTASEVDSKTIAIIKNASREYERIKQLGAEAADLDKQKAQAFEATFATAYKDILIDPESVSPTARILAIADYNTKIAGLAEIQAAKQQASIEKRLNTAKQLFGKAARESPDDVTDKGRTIANLLDEIGKDVVAELDKQIADLMVVRDGQAARVAEAIRTRDDVKERNAKSPNAGGYASSSNVTYQTERAAKEEEKLAVLDNSLAQVKALKTAYRNTREETNTNAEVVNAARLKDLKSQVEKAITLKVPVSPEVLDAIKKLEGGGGTITDEVSKKTTLTDVVTIDRLLKGLSNETERFERAAENAKSIAKTRSEVAAQVAERRNEAEMQKVISRTGTLTQTSRGLGLSPEQLKGSIEEQRDAIQGAQKSGNTAVDKVSSTLIGKAEFQLKAVDAEIARLERESNAGDSKATADANALIAGRQQELRSKIEKYKGDRDERNEELARKALVQLADKFEEDAKTQVDATKSRFDDAVAAGQLTAEKLERYSKQEAVLLDQLAKAFETKLLADKVYSPDGKLNADGIEALDKFKRQQRSTYKGVDGAKGLISSLDTDFAEKAKVAERDGSGEDPVDRKRRQAATGVEFAAATNAVAIQALEAKREQLAEIDAAIKTSQSALDGIDTTSADAITRTKEITENITLLIKEQGELTDEMGDLIVKAEESNGSYAEEMAQILDMVSPESFMDRAVKGREALSGGFGQAIEASINGIGDALVEATKKGKSFKAEMKSVALEVGDALAKMLVRQGIAEFIALLAGGIKGFFTGPSTGAQPLNVIDSPNLTIGNPGNGQMFAKDGWSDISVKRYAAGGFIKGRGSATSDEVQGYVADSSGNPVGKVLVSNGESILTGKATKMLGKRTIDMLNKGQSPMTQQAVSMSTGVVNNMSTQSVELNMPISVSSGDEGSAMTGGSAKRLQESLRSAVLAEIERQKRPGGALRGGR